MSTRLQEQEFIALMKRHKARVERKLALLANRERPGFVYEPIRYVLNSGGKRVRSVLVLLACEAVGGTAHSAVSAAAAIELLHNFTLIHDDVMDNAEKRRGRPTVHHKWNQNVAILSGDELIAHAYRFLLQTRSSRLQEILAVFTDAFIEVCEGQGFDKEFESDRNVTVHDYLMMIRKKTARLISAATEIGALIGGGSREEIASLRRFGEHLGVAFQIKDDYLDIAGDEREFGKIIGGDIVEGKKTYLLVKALEHTAGVDRKLLEKVAPNNGINKRTIERVLGIYNRVGVLDDARREIGRSSFLADRKLSALKPGKAKDALLRLSRQLLERSS